MFTVLTRLKRLRIKYWILIAVVSLWALTIVILDLKQKYRLAQMVSDAKSLRNYEYPWELCRPMHFLPDPETRPLTALASFEGSGNTWVRYLLQQSTGIHTGSADCGTSLLLNGFPGEAVADGSVSVVKTHGHDLDTRRKYQKVVLIVRDPGAAILANFNRLMGAGGHTDNAHLFWFYLWWKKRFYEGLPVWTETNLDWLQNFRGPLHVVRYEDLVDDLETTLRALITFLELPVDEAALQCTLERSEGAYHRHRQTYTFELFDEDMLRSKKAAEDVVYEELRKRKV